MCRCVRQLFRYRTFVLPLLLVGTLTASDCFGGQTVRSEAALAVSFDEADGNAKVTGTNLPEPFFASLVGKPVRVPSPFWSQGGKKALRLDAAKKQFVQLADIPNLDRPDAVSVSLFFLSLHPPTDSAPHGILAKRSDGARGTNYGINYVPAADIFQVYVNDGRGFRIANYSARRVVGTRRLVHLTATLQLGNADPKADSRRDDLLVRLYVNGEPAVPKSVTGGLIRGKEVWLTRLNTAGLLNDAPLTLGSSTPQSEYTSGVFDEFLLFTRALTPSEANRLFLEMAGPNGPQLARRELQTRPLSEPPAIESISQLGLQIGQTTRLSIQGSRLAGDPRVDLPIAGLKQNVVHGSDKSHLMVDLTLPADVPPGIYPLSVVTKNGISKPVGIAVDGLTQWLVGDSTAEHPTALPAAFSGLISGAAQSRVYFNGKAGARIVAEVEAKRIGSSLDPVLELKNTSGAAAVAIEWGKAYLRGDARIEAVLPADGTYFVELHDLEYRAPTDSPFRLLVGDFRAVDQYFPAVAERGSELSVEPVGTGLPSGAVIAADLKNETNGLAKFLNVPRELHASGPLPPLRISDGLEFVEVQQPGKQLQTIDARFADKKYASVAVNGRLSKAGEVDRYLLAVTPGKALALSVDGQSLNSPVEGEISVFTHEGKMVASDGGSPGAVAQGLQYQAPADVSSVEVRVRDLLGRGGPHFVYRLRIAPAGRPNFALTLLDSRINVPRHGNTVAELRVDRQGYAGPIDLKIEGNDGVAISPPQLPAEGMSRNVLITVSATKKSLPPVARLRLVGESVGITPPIHRVAVIRSQNQQQLAGFLDSIPVAPTAESPARIDVGELPAVLLKGVDMEWPVKPSASSGPAGDWLRLSLVSTEAKRPNPQGRRRKVKPTIAALPNQAISTAAAKGSVKVSVPLDVAEPAIDFVVKADVVSNPYSNRVLATSYSKPFRMLVQDPLGLQMNAASLNLVGGAAGKIRGKLIRHPAFKQPVNVALAGLPAGYTAAAISVPGDKTEFEIPITVAKEPTARSISNVSIKVSLADGKVPVTQPIELKVAPPAAPPATKK